MTAGLKWNERNEYACPYCRSCRFDNVCLNHSSLQVQYYSGKDPVPLFYDMKANAHNTFPDDFLNTGRKPASGSVMHHLVQICILDVAMHP